MLLLVIVRIILLVVSLSSLIILVNRYFLNHREWTAKTRDYWYSQFMWSIAGVSIAVEGLIRHSGFRYSFVFILSAAIGNLIGLHRKGPWGTNNVR